MCVKLVKELFPPINYESLKTDSLSHTPLSHVSALACECYCIGSAAETRQQQLKRTQISVKWSILQGNLHVNEGKHTHTPGMNTELKGWTITTLLHWQHLVEHTRALQIWGHTTSFHCRLQLCVSQKHDFTLNFSTPSFSARRKTEEEYEQKNTSERISIFGSWWARRCFTVVTPPPPPLQCLPPNPTITELFLDDKYVLYLKVALRELNDTAQDICRGLTLTT